MCVLALAGCSLEKGFRDTSDALSPEDTLYIDGPGYQLLPGKFYGLDYQADLMFARRSDAEASDLMVVDPQRQKMCELPGAVNYRHWVPPWIAYQSEADENGFGRLRFATPQCEPLNFELSSARLPFDITEKGEAVIRVGDGIVRADPLTSEQTSIVEKFEGIRLLSFRASDKVPNYLWLLQIDRSLTAFDADWTQLGTYGREIRRLVGLSDSSLLLEDADGLSILSASAGPHLSLTPFATDACEATGGKWITYFSPCEERRLKTRSASRGPLEFGVSVHPSLTKFVSLPDDKRPGQFIDQLYYLQDIDPNTGLGSLYVTEPLPEGSTAEADGIDAPEPRLLAEQADLGWLSVQSEGVYVLAKVRDGIGTLMFIDREFAEHKLVTGVPRQIPNASNYGVDGFVLSNADVATGTGELVQVDRIPSGSESPVPAVNFAAAKVPLDGGFIADTGSGSAVLQDFDGARGTLAMASGPRIGQSAGSGVPKWGFVSLTGFGLPGVAFFSQYNFEKGTGNLEYWNVEIDARGIVSNNVSEFMLVPWPHAGVVYAVQNGDQSGVWFARAK
ncbi:MAG TPA: hypothetical protein VFQ61_25415 [Polyangiaceae bacterium]|nr:hypothetical protein [Polyangiaceae bacterium]